MSLRILVTSVLTAALPAIQALAPAAADTHLFPVIASNSPNVVTLVSVGNREGGISTHLSYLYRYKAALTVELTPNTDGSCDSTQFARPTFNGDLVTFDASGYLNDGNALFGDTNDYEDSFDIGLAGPVRAYLLVSNAAATGRRVDDGHPRDVFGDFIVIDIASGGAWGGKGVNDTIREDYTFINAEHEGGGVWAALPANGFTNRRITFLPPSEWTTRFFVTPIGSNMDTANLTASVGLLHDTGVFDRQGINHYFAPISHTVRCTGAVNLEDLMDSTVWSAVENVGGWARFAVESGDAVVYKLDYTADNSTYGGTVNNGYLLSGFTLP